LPHVGRPNQVLSLDVSIACNVRFGEKLVGVANDGPESAIPGSWWHRPELRHRGGPGLEARELIGSRAFAPRCETPAALRLP